MEVKSEDDNSKGLQRKPAKRIAIAFCRCFGMHLELLLCGGVLLRQRHALCSHRLQRCLQLLDLVLQRSQTSADNTSGLQFLLMQHYSSLRDSSSLCCCWRLEESSGWRIEQVGARLPFLVSGTCAAAHALLARPSAWPWSLSSVLFPLQSPHCRHRSLIQHCPWRDYSGTPR